MKRTNAYLLLLTSLGSGVLLPHSAAAQTAPGQPPQYQTLDENQVDMSRRILVAPLVGVSIGPDGPGGLSYQWTMDRVHDLAQLNGKVTIDASTGKATVALLGRSILFTPTSGTYAPDIKDGSTLVNSGTTWTFTSSDGTVAVIDAGSGTTSARLRSLVLPNGISRNFYYISDQLRAVTTSTGYQLRLTYSSTDPLALPSQAVAFNMAFENCAPTAASCTLAGTWPTASATVAAATSTVGQYTDPVNQITTVANPSGGIYSITKPSGRFTSYVGAYQTSGSYLVHSVTRAGDTWNYSSQGGGAPPINFIYRPTATQNEVYHSNFDGRLVGIYYPIVSRQATMAYNSNGQMSSTSATASSEVSTTTYAYDARGNVTSSSQQSITPGTPANLAKSASYSASCGNIKTCNKPNYTLDELGRQTDYIYDSTHGGVATVTLPAAATGQVRPKITTSYGAYNARYYMGGGSLVTGPTAWMPTQVSRCRTNATCSGTADEIRTELTYDPDYNNLLVQTKVRDGTGALQQIVTRTYYPTGDLKTEEGPVTGAVTRYYYDAARRVTGVIGPDPDGGGARKSAAQRITYDADGLVVLKELGTATNQSDTGMSTFVPSQSVAITYDAAGRVATQASKSGSTVYALTQFTTTYIPTGMEVCVAQRMNPAAFGSLPASACSLGSQGSFGPDRITKTVYDAIGRPLSVTSGLGTSYAVAETMSYTGLTRTELIDANGNKTTATADGMLRPFKTQYPVTSIGAGVSSTTDYEQLTYNAASNITSRRLRDGSTIALTYDNLNRLKTVTPTSESQVAYTYDLAGNRLTITRSSDGAAVSYGRDSLGRTVTETQPYGALAYSYDASGRLSRMTWPDAFYVDYIYDATSQVTQVRENGATSGIGVLATYGYDELGRRTSVTYGNGTFRRYAWDAQSRLTGLQLDLSGTSGDLTIGAFGGIGTAIAYNPASQITSIGRNNDAYAWPGHVNITRSYSANGLNQYSTVAGSALSYDGRGNLTSSAGDSFTYDKRNQLTGTRGYTMTYDPAGRLMRYGTPDGLRMVYAGQNLAVELSTTGVIQRRYVYGPGVDEPIVWYEGSGTASRRFLQADERGSIIAVTSAAGAVLNFNSYDEFGIPESGHLGRFAYTGQTHFAEIGLYYYKARMYSPSLGRFLQTDPIGYADGVNWYAYVGNDPVNRIDPAGLASEIVVTGYVDRCPDGSTCYNYDQIRDLFPQFSLPSTTEWRNVNLFTHHLEDDGSQSSPQIGTQYGPCPSNGAWTIGIGVDLFFGIGGSLEGGLVFEGGNFDLYGAFGYGGGIDIGVSGRVGRYNSMEDLQGASDDRSLSLVVGVGDSRHPHSGRELGRSATFGADLGYHHSRSHTALAGVGGESECILGD